jgi:hypothetical protein
MWRGKPNHCFVAAVSAGNGTELYLVIARDEQDAQQLMGRRYSAKPDEKITTRAVWPDDVAKQCGINLDAHGAFAALDLVWVKSG